MKTHAQYPNEGREDRRLLGSLLKVPYHALMARLQEGLAASGYTDLHPPHFTAIQYIRPEGSWVKEMAERAHMTKQAMGQIVEYLEIRGYIDCAADPRDGRAKVVRLTARGLAAERRAKEIIQEMETEWARQLGTQRMSEFQQTLQDLISLLEE